MLTYDEYTNLKNGQVIRYCKKLLVVDGRHEGYPCLRYADTGEMLYGAIYALHLMTLSDEEAVIKKAPEPREEKVSVLEEKDVKSISSQEVSVPVKRGRGRPRKNPL